MKDRPRAWQGACRRGAGVVLHGGLLAVILAGCAEGQVAFDTNSDASEPTDTHGTDSLGPETGTGESAETGDTIDSATPDSGTEPDWPEPCSVYTTPVATGAVVDPDLDELSGIAASRTNPGVLWVHEDHLGAAELYALDSAGNTLATVELEDATNNDWEDLAVAPCGDESCLWVGEIGNNDFDREGMGVYRLVEPDLSTLSDTRVSLPWEFFGFAYPDDAENSEALAVDADGIPVIFTKRYELGTSGVYRFPTLDPGEEVILDHVAEIITANEGDVGGAAALTAADLWPDGTRVALRTYTDQFELDIDDWATLAESPRRDLSPPAEVGGEAIAYDPFSRGLWQVAEGVGSSLYYTACADAVRGGGSP